MIPVTAKKALHEWRLYLFLIPAVVLVSTFSYFPAASAIYHSFFRWGGGENKEFVGFANFHRALTDQVFWESFLVIGILIIANVVKLIPSILTAVLIHRLKNDRWQYLYRIAVVLPMVVPGLVTLFVWKFFFDPTHGALNVFLEISGLKNVLILLDQHVLHWGSFVPGVSTAWLGDPNLIVPALVLWGFPWIGAVGVLIYLAGLQSIGSEVYEAAGLDGANGWQIFIHVELPLIMTQIRLSLVLLIIGTLQGYGLQFLLLGENGGAGGRGMVPGLWMFNQAFFVGDFGYACALGMILFVFILVLTLINNRWVRVEK
jgi:raffinose/stachyose/melibiose transport system permease protein